MASAMNTGSHSEGLEPNVVSFWGLVSQSLAGMAPTCDVVAFMTAGAAFALVALPLSYLLAFALMFIEVNTIYHLSKHRNSAGGYYAYVSTGLGPTAALVTAIMVVFYQTVSVAGVPVYVAGVFLPGLARMVGLTLPSWFWLVGILFFIGVPWLLTVLGIRPTVKTLVVTSGIEIAFLIVTAIIIISRTHIIHPLHPFDMASVGVKGVAMGMIFAITSFIGVGSHAPLGEESKVQGIQTQKGRVIGKAAIVSLTLVGAALTLAAYALTVGWGQANMGAFATANAPGVTVYLHYLGPVGAIALVLLAINSALMDDLALLTSSARVLYAVGRDKLLQTSFAQVNGRRAPVNSVTFLAVTALVIGLAFGFWLGPAQAFNVLTTAVLFGLVTAHTLMNISLMRISHGERNMGQVVFHLALPVLAMGLFWFVLYESLLPFVFPLAWAAVFWALAITPAIIYAIRATRHIDPSRGHHLGVHEEDVSVGV
ncbi:MAG: APC family permease [Sulfobacillus acidophilus]|uniref:APC family permease n=1 Tax=Sulfobacillus acidophilus TaxID=53633 RepID=A0A2T2WJ27_9FIRM|nr:MAG: APC family permease [Sulfobacillus acidophilus]